MGENLMVAPGTNRGPSITITDPKACKSYICGTCPHDLFTNTKQDLGPCPKTHNEALKDEYENADDAQKRKWGFDFDYLRDMQRYIDDCNRRIDQAQRRLEKTPDEIRQTNALVCSYLLPRQLPRTAADFQTTAQTNQRALTQHRERAARNSSSGRARQCQHSRHRILQDQAAQADERGSRKRAQSTIRHIGPIGPSKATSLRRLRRISQQTGQ